jgi:very-short-patch-repair endonuclease
MPAKKTLSELKLEIKSMYDNEYEYISGDYVNQKSKIKIKHSNGTVIETTLKSYREGKNLYIESKEIHSTKKLTLDVFKKRLSKLNPSIEYIDPENFKGRKYPGKFKCKSCSHEWNVKRVEQLIESKDIKRTSCPVCSNQNRGQYLRDIKYLDNILKETIDGKEYTWIDEYSFDNKKKYMIIHNVCGTVYKAQALSFKNGEQRCPTCFENDSRHVRMIKSLLESLDIEFTTEKTFKTCRNVYELPFDFYIKSKDLLIEYDGSQHYRPWGSDQKNLERLIKNDNIKNQWCIDNKRNLLRLNYKQSDEEIINTIKEKLL